MNWSTFVPCYAAALVLAVIAAACGILYGLAIALASGGLASEGLL